MKVEGDLDEKMWRKCEMLRKCGSNLAENKKQWLKGQEVSSSSVVRVAQLVLVLVAQCTTSVSVVFTTSVSVSSNSSVSVSYN